MTDSSGASASGPGSREPSPAVSAASGFDPSRRHFDHAKMAVAVSRIARLVSQETANLAEGMWNPAFCSADASDRALMFFSDLRSQIDRYSEQALAASLRRDRDGAEGGDGLTGSGASAPPSPGRTASPETCPETPSQIHTTGDQG